MGRTALTSHSGRQPSSARRCTEVVVSSGFSLMNSTATSARSAIGVATRNRVAVASP